MINPPDARPLSIAVGGRAVAALLLTPAGAQTCFVFAHGAGAGMQHASMTSIAAGLAARGIATLRYQFPYMQDGSRRPDRPALCHATVRAAVARAAQEAPGMRLLAGGKSFGGRMTSQAQAIEPLEGVSGLAFLAFPLHPAGKPDGSRAAHLAQVHIPMLFLQGTADALADLALLREVVQGLGTRAALCTAAGADHAFHVPKRRGQTPVEALNALLDAFAAWAAQCD